MVEQYFVLTSFLFKQSKGRFAKLVIASFLFLLPEIVDCQTKNREVVILADLFGGYAFGSTGGFSGGWALNVQVDRHLFTVRGVANVKFHSASDELSPFTLLPAIGQRSNMQETSLLYGWRFIPDTKGYSFSLGPSWNSYTRNFKNEVGEQYSRTGKYTGMAFDASIKWFKERKRQQWWLPTKTAASIGFRLFGNVSQYSYVGIGVEIGLGYRKK